MPVQLSQKQIERFWRKIDTSGGDDACWIWKASTFHDGYGHVYLNRKNWRAHRLMWLITNGDIPDDLHVLHNCPDEDNPLCVNPAHLWLGTNTDNVKDRCHKGRTASGDRSGLRTKPWAFVRNKARGERAGSAKVNAEMVRLIRAQAASGRVISQIVNEVPISRSQVGRIVRRESWGHLP